MDRTKKTTFLLVAFSLFLIPAMVLGQPNAGVSIGKEGLEGHYLTVGEHFNQPEKKVQMIVKKKLPDEEIPVALLIAQLAGVGTEKIVDLRLGGKSWVEICEKFGVTPEAFFTPVKKEIKGPPYGKAYGYYKNKAGKGWDKIALNDQEIIDLANLKMTSEHFPCAPEQVIEMRAKG